MFNDLWYVKTDEFENLDDLREWMKYQGHLWFFINERYFFMTGSRNYNTKGEVVPWWYITNGDYRNPAVSDDSSSSAKHRIRRLSDVGGGYFSRKP